MFDSVIMRRLAQPSKILPILYHLRSLQIGNGQGGEKYPNQFNTDTILLQKRLVE